MQPPRGRPSARHTFPRPIRLERHEVDLGSGDTSCIFQSPNDEQKASDLRSGVLTDRPATLSELLTLCLLVPEARPGEDHGNSQNHLQANSPRSRNETLRGQGNRTGQRLRPRSTRPVTIPPPECPQT